MFFKRSKQISNDNVPDETPSVSQVARDAVFEGNISLSGELRVGGTVRGRISARLCVVEADGLVEGEIAADEIVVHGRVVGPLRAYHVHLQAGAQVDGDVVNETIAVDSGARINGSVWRSDDPLGTAEAEVPVKPVAESPSFLQSPLWSGHSDDGYRPLTAIRPK